MISPSGPLHPQSRYYDHRAYCARLTTPLLLLGILRFAYLYHLAIRKGVLHRITAVKGLAGDDAIDFWAAVNSCSLFLWIKDTIAAMDMYL